MRAADLINNGKFNCEDLYIPYFSILKIKSAYFIEPDIIPENLYFCALKQGEPIEEI